MARPKKNINEKQNIQIKFLLNKKEKNIFENNYISFLKDNNLTKNHFSKSDYIRFFILNKQNSKKIFDFNIGKLIFEINKIGQNINQSAKKINSFFIYDSKIDVEISKINSKMNDLFLLIENKFYNDSKNNKR